MAEAEAAALVAALEQATLMAKQLPNPLTSTHLLDQSQFHQIYSSLQAARHHLSLFLSHRPQPAQPPEDSLSSAVGGGGDGDDMEPMLMDGGDGDNDEYNSKAPNSAAVAGIEGVEQRMRDCFIQNKRPKRPLSPSGELGARRGDGGVSADFDPEVTKLRSLELMYQFHG